MPVAKWSKCFIIRIPAVCRQSVKFSKNYQMLLHFRSCFIFSACFTHFNLSRLGSTLKLAGQGAFVRWSHLCQFQDSSLHMSTYYIPEGFGAQHDPKTSQSRPAPVITGVLITISSPNGASASNFQIARFTFDTCQGSRSCSTNRTPQYFANFASSQMFTYVASMLLY